MDAGTEILADLRQAAHHAGGGVVIIIGSRLVRAADVHDHALMVPAGGHDAGATLGADRLVDIGLNLRQPLIEPVDFRPVGRIAHPGKARTSRIALYPVDVETGCGEDLLPQFQSGQIIFVQGIGAFMVVTGDRLAGIGGEKHRHDHGFVASAVGPVDHPEVRAPIVTIEKLRHPRRIFIADPHAHRAGRIGIP